MFATVHNMHLPQFISPISELRALAIDALSQDWQGRSMFMFPPYPLLSRLRTTQEGEVILIAPGGLTTMVSTSTKSLCGTPSLLSIPPGPIVISRICLDWQIIPSACLEALMQHYQAAEFFKEAPRLVAAPRRPSTNRVYDGRWLHFAHWAAGQGIDLLLYIISLILRACHLSLSKDTDPA